MVLAVLEARCGVRFSGHDVYLAVAGGLRLSEPAADLAVAAALVASLTGLSLPAKQVYFGEIGLSGAIWPGVTGTKTECSLSGRRMARVGKA
jgi:DNA repair protein RadA/Sms